MRYYTPTAAARRAVVVVARRRGTTGGVSTIHHSPDASGGYNPAILDDSSFRKRPWEKEQLKNWCVNFVIFHFRS